MRTPSETPRTDAWLDTLHKSYATYGKEYASEVTLLCRQLERELAQARRELEDATKQRESDLSLASHLTSAIASAQAENERLRDLVKQLQLEQDTAIDRADSLARELEDAKSEQCEDCDHGICGGKICECCNGSGRVLISDLLRWSKLKLADAREANKVLARELETMTAALEKDLYDDLCEFLRDQEEADLVDGHWKPNEAMNLLQRLEEEHARSLSALEREGRVSVPKADIEEAAAMLTTMSEHIQRTLGDNYYMPLLDKLRPLLSAPKEK